MALSSTTASGAVVVHPKDEPKFSFGATTEVLLRFDRSPDGSNTPGVPGLD
jgi:hypothetical protein